MTLRTDRMELTNLETVPGKAVTRHLGLVQGSPCGASTPVAT